MRWCLAVLNNEKNWQNTKCVLVNCTQAQWHDKQYNIANILSLCCVISLEWKLDRCNICVCTWEMYQLCLFLTDVSIVCDMFISCGWQMCTHACSLHMPSYWPQRLLPSWWRALMLLFPLNSASTCVSTRLLQQMGFAGSASINKVFKKFTSNIWTKHMLSNKR